MHDLLLNATAMLGAVDPPLATGGVDSVFDFVRKGGVMMVPIGICSLIVVAVVAERLVVLRRSRVIPRGFEAGLEQAMDGADQPADAGLAYCRKHDSPAARMIAGGLEKLGHTPEVVEKHLASAGEHQVFTLRRRLRVLVVITAVAPLMGLTGTIFGMIKAFQTVALSGEALGKAELLAEGIYEAMITTAAGLLVAIPTLILYHWLASKIETLTRDLDQLGVEFLETHALEPPGTKDGTLAGSNGAAGAGQRRALETATADEA